MNTYEALVIFKPIVDVDNSDTALKSVEALVENLKGKIVRQDKMGRKRLAYEINKFKDGFLVNLIVQLEPAAMTDFKRACQLNEDILRLVVIRNEDYLLHQQEPAMAAGGMGRPPGRFDRDNRSFGDRPPRREFGGPGGGPGGAPGGGGFRGGDRPPREQRDS